MRSGPQGPECSGLQGRVPRVYMDGELAVCNHGFMGVRVRYIINSFTPIELVKEPNFQERNLWPSLERARARWVFAYLIEFLVQFNTKCPC